MLEELRLLGEDRPTLDELRLLREERPRPDELRLLLEERPLPREKAEEDRLERPDERDPPKLRPLLRALRPEERPAELLPPPERPLPRP